MPWKQAILFVSSAAFTGGRSDREDLASLGAAINIKTAREGGRFQRQSIPLTLVFKLKKNLTSAPQQKHQDLSDDLGVIQKGILWFRSIHSL